MIASGSESPAILIIEDEPEMAESLKWELEPLGFHVDISPDIEHARERLQERSYSSIVADMLLESSDLGGDDFLLTNDGLLGAAKRILITASGIDRVKRKQELAAADVAILEKGSEVFLDQLKTIAAGTLEGRIGTRTVALAPSQNEVSANASDSGELSSPDIKQTTVPVPPEQDGPEVTTPGQSVSSSSVVSTTNRRGLWVIVGDPKEDPDLSGLQPGKRFEYAVPRYCVKDDWLLLWLVGGTGFQYLCRMVDDPRAPLPDEHGPAQAQLAVVERLHNPITFQMLSKNKVLSQWNLVKSNMQGAVLKQRKSLFGDTRVWQALRQVIEEANPDSIDLFSTIEDEENLTKALPRSYRRRLRGIAFAPSASRVLNLAIQIKRIRKRGGDHVSSSCIFFALAEIGRRSREVEPAKFLFDCVSASTESAKQYESQVTTYCGSASALHELLVDDGPVSDEVSVTRNVDSWIAQSQQIAAVVGSRNGIGTQHVVASLLLGEGWNAHKKLAEIGLDKNQLKGDFYRTIAVIKSQENQIKWRELLFGIGAAQEYGRVLPSYASDAVDDKNENRDRLNITGDVEAFASLIAAKNLDPPLSIGLFGEWGSGKSFFMTKLRAEVDKLSRSEEDNPSLFCTDVVQIPFNAWHYVDDSLWASLVTEVFDRLFERIAGGEQMSPEKARALVEAELVKTQGLFREAQEELNVAKQEFANATTALGDLRKAREAKERAIGARLDDVGSLIKSLVQSDPEIQKELNDATQRLGIAEAARSFQSLETQVSDLQTLGKRAGAIAITILQPPGRWLRLGTLLVAIVIPIFVGHALAQLNASFSDIAAKIGSWGGLITTLSIWLARQVDRGKGALAQLESLYSRLRQIREQRMLESEAGPRGEVENLRQREQAALKKVGEVDLKIQTLECELAELKPGRRLQRFIQERSRAADYKQHLGLVSLIRQDFMTLSNFLSKRGNLPIQRIVLYIDDLDRCPPERVVEVLEAIHLLLAFKLFVVVVGVDVRWVSRSLLGRYRNLLLDDSQSGRDPLASPHDYMEKIFQIPFWIRPMDAKGSEELLAGLLENPEVDGTEGHRVGVGQAAPKDSEVANPSDNISYSAMDQAVPTEPAPQHGSSTTISQTPSPVSDANPRQKEKETILKRLSIEPAELDFMKGLAQFVGTSPRRIKRFVNIYRLLKASVPTDELASFFVSGSHSEEYQVALVLLAILTGSPELAPTVLRQIREADGNATVEEFRMTLKQNEAASGNGDNTRVMAILEYYQQKKGTQVTLRDLKRWVPLAARYSFRSCT